MRGTPEPHIQIDGKCRFSPAGAGNASPSRKPLNSTPVQPRGCGERLATISITSSRHGSAPRVRGTRYVLADIKAGDRFSPAGAGNAAIPQASASVAPVQPRGCGERSSADGARHKTRGSAPRVRGTRLCVFGLPGVVRFSPAGAGNASASRRAAALAAVQPRGCGERFLFAGRALANTGSAPRVRGTHK